MGEWKTAYLEDLCSQIVTGGTPLTSHKGYYEGGTIPWLNTTEVNFGRIHATSKRITDAGLSHSAAKWIPPNSVIVAMYGATAGKVATNEIPLTTNQACCNLVINHAKADYRFVYYSLVMNYPKLSGLANGAAQQNLNSVIIRQFPIAVPPLPIQRRIAHILGTLDDKIELNRRMNRNLEKMAAAIFKSWFIDFDPVWRNAARDRNQPSPPSPLPAGEGWPTGRGEGCVETFAPSFPLPLGEGQGEGSVEAFDRLFPDTFEDSVLGQIPKGWKVGRLDDLLVLQRGFDLPVGQRKRGSVPVVMASGIGDYHNEYKVSGPGVVTGRSGKLGDVFLIPSNFWPLNTTLWVKEYRETRPCHAYLLLKGLALSSYNAGSAVPTLNRNHIHNVRVVLPPRDIVDAYEHLAMSFYRKCWANEEQNRHLSGLRDTLLPKLMSSEIEVSDFVSIGKEVEV